LVLVAAVAVAGPRAVAAEGDVTGFVVPTAGALPHGVTRGPDGAIWFTERFVGKIGRLEGGVFQEHDLPLAASEPTAIVTGPDGNLWFVEQAAGQIGRMTPAGTLAELPTSDPTSTPSGIAIGPDGLVWFTERTTSQIGRYSLDGQTLDVWPTLTANAAPMGITAGPDGAVWFTERGVAKLGRIAPDGTRTEYALPAGSLPTGIATGPDGDLWVTLRGRNSIARMTAAGVLDAEFVLPTLAAGASHIVAGPQGALWFTESTAAKIGRITVNGTITEYPLAVGALPQGIVEGFDGVPWFAEANADRIARMDLTPPDTTAPTIEITSPLTGTLLVVGQQTPADYSCTDEAGGSGIAACDGPVADGAAVPTGSLGATTFTVNAADVAGNPAQASTSYLVFRSIEGTIFEPSPRAGAWLTLSLGMDLGARDPDPLAAATTQEVSCTDGDAIGGAQPAAVRTRITQDGELLLRWDTMRSWAGRCRTLTLTFSATGWQGVPATFLVSWG
jgi:virginiamycin B lyase